MRKLWFTAGLVALLLTTMLLNANAQAVVKVYAGANGIWVADEARPADFELGGSAAASLSPHIAAVGGIWYGVAHSYIRGSAGARYTVTDASDPNFSIGLGGSYHFSSEPAIRPEEFCVEAAIGWKPWPQLYRVTLVALGAYGLDTSEAHMIAGVRYDIHLP